MDQLMAIDPLRAGEPFTDEERLDLQARLWQLLARQTDFYTMGTSSSIPVEMAEELYSSLLFTLAEGLKYGAFSRTQLLAAQDLGLLLQSGRKTIDQQVEIGKRLWLEVEQHPPGIRNRSYEDTLKGLVTFFKRYDSRYFAHQIPGDIDYQLCLPVPDEQQGVEYVNEYLRRLLMENSFLRCFEPAQVTKLLHSCCPDPYGQHINLYEPVAANVIGQALVQADIFTLDMTVAGKESLLQKLRNCDRGKMLRLLEKAAGESASALQASGSPAGDYLRRTAAELLPRLLVDMQTGKISTFQSLD